MELSNTNRRSRRDSLTMGQTPEPIEAAGATRESSEMTRKVRSEMKKLRIIGRDAKLLAAVERALRVAPTTMSVLITGESGTGKENIARMIHDNSDRKTKVFIPVNCGALPEGTIDSELFGYVKGAFTGADNDHVGFFESADGGTIFLDEVGELPLQTQVRLLRVLENGEFTPVGANKPRKTTARVVAATNRDMQQMVNEGRFREDLFYRLSTVQIALPPLRERGSDLRLIIDEFVDTYSNNNNSERPMFTADAITAMESYPWRGNIRQLRNIIEQICLFEAGHTVTAAMLREHYLPDMGSKPELIVANKPKYDYDHDRELIFRMIMQLHREIDELKAHGAATAHVNTSLNELKRETPAHYLMSGEAADDNDRSYSDIVVKHEEFAPSERPQDLGHATEVGYDPAPRTATPAGQTPLKSLDEIKRDVIEDALAEFGGNRRRAAEALQISERTLYRKIKLYGLE